MKKINLITKNIIDLIGSFIGIVILSPLFIVVALLIKSESDGPVFFKQKRLGYRGQTFEIVKFRTMVENAENLGDGLSIKSENDSRITKVGKFLRKTSLDELPQLFNIFMGDMSLVGPRPPVTYHPYEGYEGYSEKYKKRFNMKPGVTGLAQVEVRNAVSWDQRIEYDIKYIEDYSIILDTKIIIKTIFKIFQSDDIYMDYQD